jgi:small-conductance mechanosensitive channel
VIQTATPGQEVPRPEWLPAAIPAWAFRVALAVSVLVVSYYLSKVVRQLLGRRIARRFKRPSVNRTVLRGIQAGIVLVGVFVALGIFGLGLDNLVLSVGVFSAVVGIILAPIIGNVLSGVFILNEQPYEIGDMIEIEDIDTQGFVEDITLLYTKVFTLDNTFLVMPNGAMRDRDVINYSAEDTRIRLTLDVGVTYESDIAEARKQLEAAAREVDEVIEGGPNIRIGSARYPAAPRCYIRAFGDSEVALRLRYWASEPYKPGTVRSKVLTNTWGRFERADIEIPYPHSHLVFDDTSGELQVSMREAADAAASRPGGATTHARTVEGDTAQQAPEGDPEASSEEGDPGATSSR